jgi:hypothetical protein
MSAELGRFRGRPPPPSWKPPPLPDETESLESKSKTNFQSDNSKQSGEDNNTQTNSQISKNVDVASNVQKSAKEKSAESLQTSAKEETKKSEKGSTSLEKSSPKQTVESKKEQLPEQTSKPTKTFEPNPVKLTFGQVSNEDYLPAAQPTLLGLSQKDNSKNFEAESSKVPKEDSFQAKQVLAAKDVHESLSGRGSQNGLASLKSLPIKPDVAPNNNKQDEVKIGNWNIYSFTVCSQVNLCVMCAVMSTVKMQTYHYILSGFVKPNIFLKSV